MLKRYGVARRAKALSVKSRKMRLDELLVERGLAENRSQAQRLILAGQVHLGDAVADKPGRQVADDAGIELRQALPYVSRGGFKLAAALDAFQVQPSGWVCADIGSSTGGFTDCLLQRGALRVYAIDVGYGQLAWSLRQDPRVISLERVNVRYLSDLPEPVAFATVDVSFIGLDLVLPRVAALLQPDGQAVVLIKPQFEVGKGRVGKGGVVREAALHREVVERVLIDAALNGLSPAGLIRSPIVGPAGNVEFLAWLRLGAATPDEAVRAAWLASLGLSL